MAKNIENLHPLANLALRTSLAVVAMGGGIVSSANHDPTTSVEVAAPAGTLGDGVGTEGALETNGQHPESTFPIEVQSYVNKNTVYLYGDGCSGSLLRPNGNPNSAPVGVTFAKHCGFVTDPTTSSNGKAPLLSSVNGSTYDVRSNIIVESGEDQDNMSPIGAITEVITADGLGNDYALGVLPGATAEEVVKAYQSEHLSSSDINNLTPGKSKIFMRGWPVNQKETTPNDMTAQQFEMTYIGKVATNVSSGQRLNLLVVAIPKGENNDSSVCSFGASGSSGIVLENGKPQIVGSLSAFWGFENLYGGTDVSNYNPSGDLADIKEDFPDVDWSKYVAACGFNYEIPESTTSIQIVPSSSAIPGEGSPMNEAVYQAGLDFSDPDSSRTIVNGIAQVSFPDKGGQYGEVEMSINNPLISIGVNGDIMLGYYNSPGMVSAVDVSPDSGAILNFYPNEPDTSIDTEVSTGNLIYPSTNNNDFQVGSLKDSNGLSFGYLSQTPDEQLSNQTPWSLTVNDGQFTFAPNNPS